ncbi:hypothetical protein P3T24_001760 [Paraburkholderia sp. GAS33]|jgi:hypothetical protein|uniref:hypothetical protein n=1 Tax=Paraburkholderia sp. GAS33 TaxID=3035130 RepID=UPI003D24719F
MSSHNLVFLPFAAFHHGEIGRAVILSFFDALILLCIGSLIFLIVNYAGVKVQTAEAKVLAKRIVPAHWEWQGRGRFTTYAYVAEYEILDLNVNGQDMTYRPTPWIMERTIANTTEPVQFVAGRLNGKVQIKKFKYL